MIIDFHSHILPGIDDGSRDVETTCEMLRKSADQGVEVMVATPHFYANQMQMKSFLEQREEAFQQVMEAPREESIRIIKGAEVAFFPGMSRAEELPLLCIENTRLMLVEMPFCSWTNKEIKELEGLINRGMTPIMAHLERFYGFQKDKKIMNELLELPVYVQLNAEAFLSWWLRRMPLKLLKNGDAHLLGSDAHSVHRRPPNLAEGRKVIEERLGREALDDIDRLGEKLLQLKCTMHSAQ